jgi:hypothetical protein
MELFKSIRLRAGKNLLGKKLEKTKRKVFYSNFGLVRKIAIVWDASYSDEFPVLSKFCQKMLERNVEVRILGYYPGKHLPDQYTANRYLTCIRRDELNFLYHPISSESAAFINNSFDVLIDMNFHNLLPLRYLSAMSNASFKVGLVDGEKSNSPFDLILEIGKPIRVEDYLNQAVQYLEMINAGEPQKIY